MAQATVTINFVTGTTTAIDTSSKLLKLLCEIDDKNKLINKTLGGGDRGGGSAATINRPTSPGGGSGGNVVDLTALVSLGSEQSASLAAIASLIVQTNRLLESGLSVAAIAPTTAAEAGPTRQETTEDFKELTESFSQSITESIGGSVFDAFDAVTDKGFIGTLFSPLNDLLSGLKEGIAFSISQSLTGTFAGGLASAVESQLAPFIGSGGLLGESFGKLLGQGTSKALGGLSNEYQQTFEEIQKFVDGIDDKKTRKNLQFLLKEIAAAPKEINEAFTDSLGGERAVTVRSLGVKAAQRTSRAGDQSAAREEAAAQLRESNIKADPSRRSVDVKELKRTIEKRESKLAEVSKEVEANEKALTGLREEKKDEKDPLFATIKGTLAKDKAIQASLIEEIASLGLAYSGGSGGAEAVDAAIVQKEARISELKEAIAALSKQEIEDVRLVEAASKKVSEANAPITISKTATDKDITDAAANREKLVKVSAAAQERFEKTTESIAIASQEIVSQQDQIALLSSLVVGGAAIAEEDVRAVQLALSEQKRLLLAAETDVDNIKSGNFRGSLGRDDAILFGINQEKTKIRESRKKATSKTSTPEEVEAAKKKESESLKSLEGLRRERKQNKPLVKEDKKIQDVIDAQSEFVASVKDKIQFLGEENAGDLIKQLSALEIVSAASLKKLVDARLEIAGKNVAEKSESADKLSGQLQIIRAAQKESIKAAEENAIAISKAEATLASFFREVPEGYLKVAKALADSLSEPFDLDSLPAILASDEIGADIGAGYEVATNSILVTKELLDAARKQSLSVEQSKALSKALAEARDANFASFDGLENLALGRDLGLSGDGVEIDQQQYKDLLLGASDVEPEKLARSLSTGKQAVGALNQLDQKSGANLADAIELLQQSEVTVATISKRLESLVPRLSLDSAAKASEFIGGLKDKLATVESEIIAASKSGKNNLGGRREVEETIESTFLEAVEFLRSFDKIAQFNDEFGAEGEKAKATIKSQAKSAVELIVGLKRASKIDVSAEVSQSIDKIKAEISSLDDLAEALSGIDEFDGEAIAELANSIRAQVKISGQSILGAASSLKSKSDEKELEARDQIREIAPQFSRRRELNPIARTAGIDTESIKSLSTKDLIAEIAKTENLQETYQQVLDVSRNRAQKQLAREEQLKDGLELVAKAAAASTTGLRSIAKAGVGLAQDINDATITQQLKAGFGAAAATAGEIAAARITQGGQDFLDGATRLAGGTVKAFRAIEGFEKGVLALNPALGTAKGILKNVALPIAATAAAAQLPVLGPAIASANSALTGGISGQIAGLLPEIGVTGTGIAGAIQGAVVQVLSGAEATIAQAIAGAITPVIAGNAVLGGFETALKLTGDRIVAAADAIPEQRQLAAADRPKLLAPSPKEGSGLRESTSGNAVSGLLAKYENINGPDNRETAKPLSPIESALIDDTRERIEILAKSLGLAKQSENGDEDLNEAVIKLNSAIELLSKYSKAGFTPGDRLGATGEAVRQLQSRAAVLKQSVEREISAGQKDAISRQNLEPEGIASIINDLGAVYRDLLKKTSSDEDLVSKSKLLAQEVGDIRVIIDELKRQDGDRNPKGVSPVVKRASSTAKANTTKGLNKALGNLSKESADIGDDFVVGYSEGLERSRNNAIEAIALLADESVAELKQRLGIRSPSLIAMQIGEFFAEGWIKGLQKIGDFDIDALVQPQLDKLKSAKLPTIEQAKSTIRDNQPIVRDAIVNTGGLVGSIVGGSQGPVGALAGDLIGALSTRLALAVGDAIAASAREVGNDADGLGRLDKAALVMTGAAERLGAIVDGLGADLTGDLAGFAVGNAVAGTVGRATGLPLTGAAAAALAVPKIQSIRAKFASGQGQEFADGFEQEVFAGADEAFAAAQAIANSAILGLESTLQISSPSKVAESIGRFFVDGFSIGLKGLADIKAFAGLEAKLTDLRKKSGSSNSNRNSGDRPSQAPSIDKEAPGVSNLFDSLLKRYTDRVVARSPDVEKVFEGLSGRADKTESAQKARNAKAANRLRNKSPELADNIPLTITTKDELEADLIPSDSIIGKLKAFIEQVNAAIPQAFEERFIKLQSDIELALIDLNTQSNLAALNGDDVQSQRLSSTKSELSGLSQQAATIFEQDVLSDKDLNKLNDIDAQIKEIYNTLGRDLPDLGGQLATTAQKGKKGLSELASAAKGSFAAVALFNGAEDFLQDAFFSIGSQVQATFTNFVDLERSLKTFRVVSNATAEDFNLVSASVAKLAADTPKTAQEVADLAIELSKSGLTAKQVAAVLPSVVNSSVATGETLERTGEVLGATLNQFGLLTNDTLETQANAAKVADLLTAASNASATGTNELGESLKYVGAQASQTNQSAQETITLLALLAASGIKGSSAGTGLAEAMRRLAITSAEANTSLEGFGGSSKALSAFNALKVDVRDARGEMLPTLDVLTTVRERIKDFSAGDQDVILNSLFGVRGGRAFSSIVNLADDSFNQITQSMDGFAGSTDRAAAAMQTGLSGAIETFTSSASAAGVSLVQFASAGLEPAIRGATLLVNAFNAVPGPIKAIAGGAAVAGLALTALTGAVAAYSLLNGAVIVKELRTAAALVKRVLITEALTASTKRLAAVQLLANTPLSIAGPAALGKLSTAKTAIVDIGTSIGASVGRMAAFTGSAALAAAPFILLAAGVIAVGSSLAAIAGGGDSANKSIKDLTKSYQELDDKIEAIRAKRGEGNGKDPLEEINKELGFIPKNVERFVAKPIAGIIEGISRNKVDIVTIDEGRLRTRIGKQSDLILKAQNEIDDYQKALSNPNLDKGERDLLVEKIELTIAALSQEKGATEGVEAARSSTIDTLKTYAKNLGETGEEAAKLAEKLQLASVADITGAAGDRIASITQDTTKLSNALKDAQLAGDISVENVAAKQSQIELNSLLEQQKVKIKEIADLKKQDEISKSGKAEDTPEEQDARTQALEDGETAILGIESQLLDKRIELREAAERSILEITAKSLSDRQTAIETGESKQILAITQQQAIGLKTAEQAELAKTAIAEAGIQARIAALTQNNIDLQNPKQKLTGEEEEQRLEKIASNEREITSLQTEAAQNRIDKRIELEEKALERIQKGQELRLDSINKAELQSTLLIANLRSQGAITAEQAEARKQSATANRINAEINAEQKNIDNLKSQKFSGDAESSRVEAIAASETKITELLIQRADEQTRVKTEQAEKQKQIAEEAAQKEKDLQAEALENLRQSQAEAAAVLEQTSINRQVNQQRLVNQLRAQGVSERDIAKVNARFEVEQIELNAKAKLKAEQDAIAAINALPSTTDADILQQREDDIRASKLRTSQLTLELLTNEETAQKQLHDAAIEQIDQRATALSGLRSIIGQTASNQQLISDARSRLFESKAALGEGALETKIGNTEDPKVKQNLEIQLAQLQQSNLQKRLELERQLLETSQARAKVEAEIAVAEAEIALEKAIAAGETEAELSVKRKLLDLTQTQLTLTGQAQAINLQALANEQQLKTNAGQDKINDARKPAPKESGKGKPQKPSVEDRLKASQGFNPGESVEDFLARQKAGTVSPPALPIDPTAIAIDAEGVKTRAKLDELIKATIGNRPGDVLTLPAAESAEVLPDAIDSQTNLAKASDDAVLSIQSFADALGSQKFIALGQPNIRNLFTGGTFDKGETATVAEFGPEIVQFSSGKTSLVQSPSLVKFGDDGTVYSAEQTQAMMGQYGGSKAAIATYSNPYRLTFNPQAENRLGVGNEAYQKSESADVVKTALEAIGKVIVTKIAKLEDAVTAASRKTAQVVAGVKNLPAALGADVVRQGRHSAKIANAK